MGKFLLADGNLKKVVARGKSKSWGDRNLGKCVIAQALDQGSPPIGPLVLNPTGLNGFTLNAFYAMVFEVGKDGWNRIRGDEWVEPSHAAPEYHQMILGQKGAYEEKIKQGLAGISQSVADLELLEHDIRKYEEFEGYINGLKEEDPKKKRAAMFAIKTIFVDQVDFHAGGGGQGAGRLSLAFMRNNNIMPTIVNDFIEMESLDDIHDGGKFSNLAKVEKMMLESKWTLYTEWLKVFQTAIIKRLGRLRVLAQSREFTLGQYREWLKPVIARYRMINTGMSIDSERKYIHENFIYTNSQAISIHIWTTWIFKSMTNPETLRGPGELTAQEMDNGLFGDPFGYEKWMQDNLVFNPDHGLVAEYPWISKQWADKAASSCKWIKPMTPYTSFMVLNAERTTIKTVSNALLEDTGFSFNMYVMSANIVMAKHMENEAKKEELERYINKILGLENKTDKMKGLVVGYKKDSGKYHVTFIGPEGESNSTIKDLQPFNSVKDIEEKFPDPKYIVRPYIPEYPGKEKITMDKDTDKENPETLWKIRDSLGLDGWFFKRPGPYEHQFFNHITKFFFKHSGQRFESIYSLLLSNMNIEQP